MPDEVSIYPKLMDNVGFVSDGCLCCVIIRIKITKNYFIFILQFRDSKATFLFNRIIKDTNVLIRDY